MNMKRKSLIFLGLCMVVFELTAAAGYKQIETDHHLIIFESEFSDEGMMVASFADEVYDKVTEGLSYRPQEKIPVVITGRPTWANGYYSTMPSKVTLFITSPSSLFLGSRVDNWLYSLFTHELTHYIHLTNPVGPPSVLKPIFGPEITTMNMAFMPGWWIEGITTYNETHLASGGRGDSQRFLSTIRSAAADGAMWSLSKGAYQSLTAPSGRIYLTGYLMVNYIIENFGYDTFNRINRSFTLFPFFGLSNAIEKETGLTAETIYSKAVEELSVADTVERTVVSADANSSSMIIANDGSLYLSRYTLDKGITLSHLGEEPLLSRINSPDETAIAVDAYRSLVYFIFQHYEYSDSSALDNAPIGYRDLWSYNMKTGEYKRLTDKMKLDRISIHPDGNRILATEIVSDRYRLIQIDLETMEKRIISDHSGESFYFPTYSPDGEKGAAVRIKKGRSSLVLIVGDTIVPLTGLSMSEIRNPRFVGEDRLLFTSDENTPFSLYEIDLDTKEVSLLLEDPIGIFDGILIADTLYYQTYVNGFPSICSVKSDSLSKIEARITEDQSSTGFNVESQIRQFEQTSYLDLPRFLLWLPLPYTDENSIQPGIWTLWDSVLHRHMVETQAGYSFEDNLIRADLTYQYSPGPFQLTFDGTLNSPYLGSSASLSFSLPLWNAQRPQGTSSASFASKGSFLNSDGTNRMSFAASASYTYREKSAPIETLGRTSVSTRYTLQDLIYLTSWSHNFFSFAKLTVSVPSFIRNHLIRIETEGAYSHGGLFSNAVSPQSILPPDYLTGIGDDGKAKMNVRLSYLASVSGLDLPFLWGGFREITFKTYAAGSFYIDETSSYWSDTIIFGGKLSFDYLMGSGITLAPFIGGEISSTTGDYAIRLGIETDLIY
ncbi:MAG: TolB family protein [Spirochaetaceae bacterium JB067]